MSDNPFGIGKPQIKGDGDPNSTTRTLYRVNYLDKDFAIPQTYEGISPITGFRNFGLLGDYSHFKIIINAWKYTSGVEGFTTKGLLQMLRAYHGKFVYFRPHKDGDWVGGTDQGQWMQDADENDVKYFCKVIPLMLPGTKYDEDKLQIIVELDSQNYTDIQYTIDTEPV